ncbi:hypothetical protein Tco_0548029 [Tanacetum coccineum]
MTNKKVDELDVEFIEHKGEAKASMDALEKKIDDGIRKLDLSIKAMKEESDAKFEELKQLILGTSSSQSTHVDHVPQITKLAAKTALYVPPILRGYDDIRLEFHNSNAGSSTTIGKNLRPKYLDMEGSNKLDPGTTNDMNEGSARACVAMFEKMACQLVEVPETVMEATFIKGLEPTLRAAVRVMNPEGLNHAMELPVSIEDNQLFEGDMQSKGVAAIVGQTAGKGDNFEG